jgi:flagellar hook-associated protein 1
MSLFGSIQMASNSLQANQIGLQVVGQNIANASTPGYSREQVVFEPGPTQQDGALLLGTGVLVQGVQPQINQYLNESLWNSNSAAANATTQQSTYQSLEQSLNALGSDNINSQLNDFVASIQNVLNQPGSTSMQNLAVLQGGSLASTITGLSQQVGQMQSNLDQQVVGSVDSINTLVQQIGSLNVQIGQLQGGLGGASNAVGLVDQQNEAISQLSQLINVQIEPQAGGEVNIYVGGNYLVYNGTTQALATTQSSQNGVTISTPIFASTKSPVDATGGELAGEIASRDTILGGFQTSLNQFAGTLAFEFNKIYSSGQGTTGYQSLTSTQTISNASAPLEDAGLPFTPVSGSFDVQVYDSQTGQTQTTQIPVSLNGLNDNDTSLNSLVQSLNGVSGLSASITPSGQLSLATTSSNLSFAFSNDTSGVLAAVGLNTFFTGSNAQDLNVNPVLTNDPTKFAASQGGIGVDTNNAQAMAGFLTQPLSSAGGATITDLSNQLTSDVTESSAQATSTANGLTNYQTTLQGQQLAVSGVNIDEETVNMLSYQRAYQASAKYISTINSLLQTLIQL